ncbi:pentatricopeptide repeat-containing protein At1g02370, mitochondrial-like [Syzygium oleosum]|uniref:pentatricopeptide repeat-containing protein At1g02370, mitochondrial-like n=1 Tax=Syzygium oleosum TaxID=219896 RepID=UPI0011D1F3B6|nr:pentatricopeptide repeat-containing protein At1g02370, mitochondrial-like [Syzygium oleosum]
MNPSRRIASRLTHLRRLSAVAEAPKPAAAAPPPEARPVRIYRRLSPLAGFGGSVPKTLNEYIMEGRKLSKLDLVRCAKELRKYRRYEHALEVMQWMEKRNINFAYADHALNLDLISKVKGVDAAENYFNSLPESAKNLVTYGTLLNCYCKEANEDKALALFNKMDELNFSSTRLAFGNLMTLYLRLGKPEMVPSLVAKMKERKISLDSYAYVLWMQSYASLDDIEGVEMVWQERLNDSSQCDDWTVYSNLAAIYVKAGLFEKAESALRNLETFMKPQSREPYHFLISLYAGTSNLKEVNRVWESLKVAFKMPTNFSYLIMLQALHRLKDVEGLLKCFKEWESGCCSYDERLAKVAVSACLEHDMLEEASRLFDEAIRRSNRPFFKGREVFMLYFLKKGEVDLAMEHLAAVIARAEGEGWRPDAVITDAFLKHFEETKDTDSAEKFYELLKNEEGVKVIASKVLLKTYIAAGRTAPEIREMLERDDIIMDDELYNLCEKVCAS